MPRLPCSWQTAGAKAREAVRTQQRVHLVDEDDAGAELGGQAEQRARVPHTIAQPAPTGSPQLCIGNTQCAANGGLSVRRKLGSRTQSNRRLQSIMLGSTLLQETAYNCSARVCRLQAHSVPTTLRRGSMVRWRGRPRRTPRPPPEPAASCRFLCTAAAELG
jgi:hypothetical protein